MQEDARLVPSPRTWVYLMVMYDGAVYWEHNASVMQQHAANFIVARTEAGELFVLKDRFNPGKRVVNPAWAGIRAAQHLGWIAECERVVEEARRKVVIPVMED